MKIRHYWLQFKRRWLSYPLALIGKYVTKVLFMSCKVEVEGLDSFIKIASKESCLLTLWHNRITVICEFFNRFLPDTDYTVFLSKSRDGEAIAQLLSLYNGANQIRVPHNMRHIALKTMIDRLKTKKEIIIFTPDGPRGPCYKVKEGIILAAKEAKAHIVPFTWEANRYWQFKTWDQLRLPKPFSTIKITLGSSILFDSEMPTADAASKLEMVLSTLGGENS